MHSFSGENGLFLSLVLVNIVEMFNSFPWDIWMKFTLLLVFQLAVLCQNKRWVTQNLTF